MADITKRMLIEVSERGSQEVVANLRNVERAQEDVEQESGRVDQASKRYGTTTQNLTRWIREQRTEQRQQAFLFREGRQAISSVAFAALSLTSATSGNSKAMQLLNQTLVTGYGAFQATNLAMSALGITSGGASTAIQLLVGGGAALMAYLNTAKTSTADYAKQLERLKTIAGEGVAGISPAQARSEVDAFNQRIEAEKAELKEMQKLNEVYDDHGRLRSATTVATAGAIERQQGLIIAFERYRDAAANVLAIEEQRQAVMERETNLEGTLRKELEAINQARRAEGLEPITREQLAVLQSSSFELSLMANKHEGITGEMKKQLELQKEQREKKEPITGPPSGIIAELDWEIKNLNVKIRQSKIEAEISQLRDERDAKQRRMNQLLGQETSQLMQVRTHFQEISSAMHGLGVQGDSFVQKLVVGIDAALRIAQIIEGMNKKEGAGIGDYLSIFASFAQIALLFAHEGGVIQARSGMGLPTRYNGRREVMVKAFEGEEIITPRDPRHSSNMGGAASQTMNVQVRLFVNAIDPVSFRDYLRKPQYRRAVAEAMVQAIRYGKAG